MSRRVLSGSGLSTAQVQALIDAGDFATSDEVDAAIAALVNSSPEALDTLNELADALDGDPNFAENVLALIGGKADASHNHDGTYVGTSDARLTDARTPTAHKSSHSTGGPDALTPADIGAAAASHNHDSAYAAKSSAFVVVNHGATASTARPTGIGAVYWIGSVQPTDAVNGDLWYDTTGDV
jgi:hypothetical protein